MYGKGSWGKAKGKGKGRPFLGNRRSISRSEERVDRGPSLDRSRPPGAWACQKCARSNPLHRDTCQRCGNEQPASRGGYNSNARQGDRPGGDRDRGDRRGEQQRERGGERGGGALEPHGTPHPPPLESSPSGSWYPPAYTPGGPDYAAAAGANWPVGHPALALSTPAAAPPGGIWAEPNLPAFRDYSKERPEAYRAFLQHVKIGSGGAEVMLGDRMCLDHHVKELLPCLETWLLLQFGLPTQTRQPWRIGRLDLAGNGLSDESVFHILDRMKQLDVRIRSLDLGKNLTAEKGMEGLEWYIWNCQEPLFELGVEENEITVGADDDGTDPVSALLRCLYNHPLYPWKSETHGGGAQVTPLTLKLGGNHIAGQASLLERIREKGGNERVRFCSSGESYHSGGEEYLAVFLPGFETQRLTPEEEEAEALLDARAEGERSSSSASGSEEEPEHEESAAAPLSWLQPAASQASASPRAARGEAPAARQRKGLRAKADRQKHRKQALVKAEPAEDDCATSPGGKLLEDPYQAPAVGLAPLEGASKQRKVMNGTNGRRRKREREDQKDGALANGVPAPAGAPAGASTGKASTPRAVKRRAAAAAPGAAVQDDPYALPSELAAQTAQTAAAAREPVKKRKKRKTAPAAEAAATPAAAASLSEEAAEVEGPPDNVKICKGARPKRRAKEKSVAEDTDGTAADAEKCHSSASLARRVKLAADVEDAGTGHGNKAKTGRWHRPWEKAEIEKSSQKVEIEKPAAAGVSGGADESPDGFFVEALDLSEEEQRLLQTDIVVELQRLELNEDTNSVELLAELVIEMLVERKTPVEIESEVSDFLQDAACGFVVWLARHLKGEWLRARRQRAGATPKAMAKAALAAKCAARSATATAASSEPVAERRSASAPPLPAALPP